jgi:hypothetical protein
MLYFTRRASLLLLDHAPNKKGGVPSITRMQGQEHQPVTEEGSR